MTVQEKGKNALILQDYIAGKTKLSPRIEFLEGDKKI